MEDMKQIKSCQEQAVKQFLRDYLDKAKDEQTMNHILQDVGRYYDADRAYIFERGKGRKVHRKRESCHYEPVTSVIGS